MKSLIALLSIGLLIGCNPKSDPKLEPHEGYAEVTGGKIWYKVIGDGPGIPLMVLHGGPGGTSCRSISAFEPISKQRPVILFDQLESGRSDNPNDTTLWKPRYFVKQVEAVREALNLKEFHLLGGSWGAAVAIEFMVTGNIEGVKTVTFSSPLLSTPQWMKDSKVRISQLSQSVQDTINKYEALRDYSNSAYLAATDTFYSNFLSRKGWPVTSSSSDCDGVPRNRDIYLQMWGPTEFNATGTLRNFDRVPDLPSIEIPILFIGGEYDEVLPESLYHYQTLATGSEVIITPNAGHAQTLDNPEFYMDAVEGFLKKNSN